MIPSDSHWQKQDGTTIMPSVYMYIYKYQKVIDPRILIISQIDRQRTPRINTTKSCWEKEKHNYPRKKSRRK